MVLSSYVYTCDSSPWYPDSTLSHLSHSFSMALDFPLAVLEGSLPLKLLHLSRHGRSMNIDVHNIRDHNVLILKTMVI